MAGEPRRIGLTGGIGTGKSFVLEHLRACGVPVLDADAVSHAVVRRGQPAYAQVVTAFGASVLGPDGELDRAALAERVFAEPAARRRLEAIVHPAVWAAVDAFFEGAAGAAVVEVPLLFESGHASTFDRILVTDCPIEIQISRVVGRGGLDEPGARARIRAQMPSSERRLRADAVLDTGGTKQETLAQLERIWRGWGLAPLQRLRA